MYTNYTRKCGAHGGYLHKILLIMKITTFIIFAVILQVSAAGFAQKVTLSTSNARLTEVFNEIRNQTGYDFLFTSETLKDAKRVNIKVENAELKDVLNQLFTNQPLEYIINKKAVVVSKKEEPSFLDRVVDAFTHPVDVRGTVVDEKGMPLQGANVKVKGFKQATVTDNEGRFYLPGVDDKAVLIVSFVGYKDVEVGVKASLSVALELKSAELNEVVVAYGKTTQQALTGSVTVVKGEQIQSLPNRSFDKSLQGLVPGLLVTSGTGQPGGGLSNFVLRGIATGSDGLDGSTLRNPLIVIDGIPVTQDKHQVKSQSFDPPLNNPMAHLNPSDIETISVLKDAVAIALYGSKASNGVILVTTKKGKAGKTQFNFRSQVDFSSRLKGDVKLLNQDEYLELLYETYKNTTPGITNELILKDLKTKFPTRTDGSFYPFTDLGSLVYNNIAATYINELSMSGGNERSLFYLNLEYTKQNGIYKKSGYDRKSVRFNFENTPTDWLKLGMNTGLSYNIQDYVSLEANQYNAAFVSNPLNPIYLENGEYFLNYTFPRSPNPIAAMDYNSSQNVAYRGLTKLFVEIGFLRDFKLTSNFGVDYLMTEAKEKRDPRLYDPYTLNIGSGRVEERDLRNASLINTNILNFKKSLGQDHELNMLAGQEAQILTDRYLTVTGTGLSFFTNDQIASTTGGSRVADGSRYKQTLVSYFGQGNYDYRKKYFLSASIRTDGSSKFGENKRFGTYWSTGVGWIASSESIMRRTKDFLSYLKLRGSIGAAGNSGAIDRYTKFDRLSSLNYLNTSTLALFPGDNLPSNSNIQWEQTFTWDAGLELRLLRDRIALTMDIYQRKTSDLVYQILIPFTTGYPITLDNIGDIKNKGVELSLSTDILKFKNLKWRLDANWSTNQNKLVKANIPLLKVTGGILANEEGRNFNSYYMPIWAGVNQETGASQWIDGTGKPNSNYNAAQPEFVGKPQPDGFGTLTNTLSYKGIDLSFQLYYQYGFQIYNTYRLINDGREPYNNQDKAALDRWQKPGDMASNPKRVLNNSATLNNSTRHLINGDFIRLQNLSLSYRIPESLTRQLHLNGLRIFAQAYNLTVWNVKKQLVDVGNVNVQGSASAPGYPNSRSLSIGLNANF